MTYRNPNLALQEPCENIVAGIDTLQDAIKGRINECDQWQDGHIQELITLAQDLVSLRFRLIKLSKETW